MTVFDPDSRVSEVNREAAMKPVTVEKELIEVFELSLELWKNTGGAFDITAGCSLEKCGGFTAEKAESHQLRRSRRHSNMLVLST